MSGYLGRERIVWDIWQKMIADWREVREGRGRKQWGEEKAFAKWHLSNRETQVSGNIKGRIFMGIMETEGIFLSSV